MIDLHTHTSRSDGSLAPGELIAMAAKKGLRAVAITDHDSISGLAEGERAAAEYGIEFVPGIEVSARHDDRELHFLGLFIDRRDKGIAEAVESWMRSRRERNRRMLSRLTDAGVAIDMESLLGLTNSGEEISITRAHFARAIVRAGYCGTTDEAFKKYLYSGTPTYVKRQTVSAAEAIAVIKRSGGLPILAHPLRYRLEFPRLRRLTEELCREGLLGLECYYSSHSVYDQERLLQLAKEYRLCVSGGSDFHGASHEDVSLGTGRGRLYVPYSVYTGLQHFKDGLALADRPGQVLDSHALGVYNPV